MTAPDQRRSETHRVHQQTARTNRMCAAQQNVCGPTEYVRTSRTCAQQQKVHAPTECAGAPQLEAAMPLTGMESMRERAQRALKPCGTQQRQRPLPCELKFGPHQNGAAVCCAPSTLLCGCTACMPMGNGACHMSYDCQEQRQAPLPIGIHPASWHA